MSIATAEQGAAGPGWRAAALVLVTYLGGSALSHGLAVPQSGLQPWQLDLAVALLALHRLGLRGLPPLLLGAGLACLPQPAGERLPDLLHALLLLAALAVVILPGWRPDSSGWRRSLAATALCAVLAATVLTGGDDLGVSGLDRSLVALAVAVSLLSAPALAVWCSPRQGGRLNQALVLPLVLLLALSLSTHILLARQSLEHAHERLSDMAYQSGIRLQRDMHAYIVALRAVEALFASSSTVTREEFDTFAESLQKPLPGLYAVAWDAYVTHEQRDGFVAEMRASGLPEFEIFEVDEQGQRRTAPARPYYVPVAFARYEGMPLQALGYDMASEPTRKAALDQALYQGVPVASGRVKLVTDPDPHYDILVLMTMRGASQPVQLIGYAGLAVRVSELMESALEGLPDQVDGRLFDLSAPRASAWLHGLPADFSPAAGWLSASRVLEIAGRRWELELIAQPAFAKARFSGIGLFCLWGGLIIAAMLSAGRARQAASGL